MAKGRQPTVVDTNVPLIANRRDGGSYACASACAQKLLSIRQGGILLLDEGGLILEEYRTYLNYRGQPGVGDAFLRWFFNNRGKVDLCKAVEITPISHSWRLFQEFPEDNDLADFDKADQKFVAVAKAHGHGAEIIQAGDHKWLKWANFLAKHDVQVAFACRGELEATALKKQSKDMQVSLRDRQRCSS